MHIRPARIFIALFILGCTACGNRETSDEPTGDPEKMSDFIRIYKELQLPWQVSDTIFTKKDKDTALIKTEVFHRFVPDSVLGKLFPKQSKIRILPLGRVEAGTETYLFTKAGSSGKTVLLVMAYNKNEEYLGAVSFTRATASSLSQTIGMDRKFALTRTMLRRNSDGTNSEGKDVFVLNAAAKEFTLIMTESLDDKLTEVINPIDTLPRTQKYAGDYSNGKMNLVSVRDGRKPGTVTIYVHFQKNNGECTGELKGEAVFTKSNIAEYRQEGDPCILQLIFSKSSVTLKEVEGCGSRRDLQCTFDGNFPKKKAPKAGGK